MEFIDRLLFVVYFGGVWLVTSSWFWYKVVVPLGKKVGFYDETI